MRTKSNCDLQQLGRLLRERGDDIVHRRLPWQFLELLCQLDEKEEAMEFQVGEVVRLRTGSNDMMVSAVLGRDEVECTYFDGMQQFTAAVGVSDLQKVEPPSHPGVPS